MATKLSIEEVSEAFHELELQEAMFDWKIGRIQVWPVFRFEVFRSFLREVGIFEYSANGFEKTSLKRANKVKVLKKVLSLVLTHRVLRLFWRSSKSSKVALIPFYRRDDSGNDHLSSHIIEQFGERGFRIGSGPRDIDLENQIHRKELNTLFRKVYGIFADFWVDRKIKPSDFQKYASFMSALENKYNFRFSNRREFPLQQFKNFIGQSWGYRDYFKLENVSTVFVVDAIHTSVIHGAKLAGTRFVELQHGSIYKQHPGHNWPEGIEVDLVPDEFLHWGDYWVQDLRFAQVTKVKLAGAIPAISAAMLASSSSVDNQVLFMSSYDITTRLFSCALELSKARPELTIIYKGHPREDLSHQIEYLKTNKSHSNLRIVENKATALDLIAESEFVVGVNSTALFEAAALKKKVLVIDIPGWEIAKPLIENGDATLVSQGAQLSEAIDRATFSQNGHFYYAKPEKLDIEFYLSRP